jgi:hypothetical protein
MKFHLYQVRSPLPPKARSFLGWKIRRESSEFMNWRIQHHCHSLFFDGASKNKPRAVGVGGILHDPRGNKIVHYSWGIVNVMNNLSKDYSLWCRLKIARNYGIWTLYVFGDSMLIIWVVIT